MWTQIVTMLVVLILATYVIQLFVPRAHGGARRTSVRWDVAPVIGFVSIVLLALSLAEAWRRVLIEAWLIGIASGLVLGAFLWIALGARADILPRRDESALRATIRAIRVLGAPVLIAVTLLALAARFLGAIVEVFSGGLVGALTLAMAVWLFLVSPQMSK